MALKSALLQVCLLLGVILLVKSQAEDDGVVPNCIRREDSIPSVPSDSETDVHQLALCQSMCMERLILLNRTESIVPGFPLWTLVTQSYLVSDMALMGRDCLFGDMPCGVPDCDRFIQSSLVRVLECKRGCQERLRNPTANNCPTVCAQDCTEDCGSSPCFANQFPPCGLFCEDINTGVAPCSTGCNVVDMEYRDIDSYPVEANPTQPPTVTKIPGTREVYEIDIIDSIPSTDGSIVGGYGTIVVRVEDLSSNGGFSYFALENSTEVDLEAFTCRLINISFAVATAMLNVSGYSPAVTITVGEEMVPNCIRREDSIPSVPSDSETDVRQLALCQSMCMERLILLNRTESIVPGFPLWTLVTQSYLVSDMALMGRDCLFGDMPCGEPNCDRFIQSSLVKVLECKRGCQERLRNPTANNCSTVCAQDCTEDCGSSPCFANQFPPCGLFCEDINTRVAPCSTGCNVVDMEYRDIDSYPVEANPTQPPTVTKIPETRAVYEIDIIDSIPSTDGSIVGGYGTIVVRVEDLSSNGGFSYFALENSTEVDLEAFTCRRISISFAVATAMLNVSDYSPAVTIAVGEETIIPNCVVPPNVQERPSVTEMEVNQAALCQAHCIDQVLNDTDLMMLPGSPVWYLVTQSYLVSDMALMGRDCLINNGEMCNSECARLQGAFQKVALCKQGCMRRYENTTVSADACSTTCVANCRSACGNQVSCFGDRVPPCGLTCASEDCLKGCNASDVFSKTMYPSDANPTSPPTLTKVEGSVYDIDVFPPSSTSMGGASSIVVRACDVLNPSSPDSCSYFFLENGTEINLVSFACRRVNVSFAVATAMHGLSDYSPATTVEITDGFLFPSQIDTLTHVGSEQDNDHFQKTRIHISWEEPQGIELADQYVIKVDLSAGFQSTDCGRSDSRVIILNNTNITEYTIESTDELLSLPITGCPYDITVEVIPRAPGVVPAKLSEVQSGLYAYPTIDDFSFNCTAVVNRVRGNYDIDISPITFGESFTPVIRDAVGGFQVNILEINSFGNPTFRRITNLVNFNEPFAILNNNPVSFRTSFINVAFVLQWNELAIRESIIDPRPKFECQLRDFGYISPDPPTNVQINLNNSRAGVAAEFGAFVALEFSWSRPRFVGSGLELYHVWLGENEAQDNVNIESLTLFQPGRTGGTLNETFIGKTSTDFQLYLQIRSVGLDDEAISLWSTPVVINVGNLDPPRPSPMTDTEFNITTFSYKIARDQDDSDFEVIVDVSVKWMFPESNELERGDEDIIDFEVWIGTTVTDREEPNPNHLIKFDNEDRQLGVFNVTKQRRVTNVQDYQSPLFVQMRAITIYGSPATWSEPEQLVIVGVSEPVNTTAQIRGSQHTRANNLNFVAVNVTVSWSQVFEGGNVGLDGDNGIVSGLGPLDETNSTIDGGTELIPGRNRRNTDDDGSTSILTPFETMTVREPDEDIVGYELLIGASPVAEEFGKPNDRSHFPQNITNENATSAFVQAVNIEVEDPENVTLYFQIRTVDRFRGASNWSEPRSLTVPPQPQAIASRVPVIVGSIVPIIIILIIAIIIVATIIGYISYIQWKRRNEYKLTGDQEGVDVWAEQWSSVPFIAPGMIDGKGPYYDEWEIPTTEVIVEDHLGEGAFGFVFKGIIRGPLRNPKLSAKLKQSIGLPVAIKLLKDTASRKERADFLQEIEMMKKISEGYNNHIVNMVGCVTLQEPLCLITEFVPHGDLLDFLRTQRKKKAAKKRQEVAMAIQLEEQRKAYEEMRRKMELMQSAQSEDSGLGRTTGESGYELMALKEPAYPQTSPAYLETDPAYPELASKNASVGDGNKPEISEKSGDRYDKLVSKDAMLQGEPLAAISEETQRDGVDDDGSSRGNSPAPYLEASNEYSHLAAKPSVQPQEAEALEQDDEDPYAELEDLEPNDLMQFAYQIATGMEYLASLNIVHRDLACRNILVGDGKNLKITDFGLSREVEEVYVKKTKGRLPLKWMALESIAEREFTTASDVWSYGVVLWEIGTVGGFPYPTIPNTDLLMMLKQGYRLEKPDNCAPEVYEIMLECWHEHPNDRPTFSQLRNKFSTLLLATTDDPYMVLEVDEAKAYYTAEEVEEKPDSRRSSVSSDDSDSSVKKHKKEVPKKPVWATPSNPYVSTPATGQVQSTNTVEGEPNGANLEGYIAMESDPVPRESLKPLPKEEINRMAELDRTTSLPEGAPPSTSLQEATIVSASLPPELTQLDQVSGVPISMLSKSEVAHRAVTGRTRSNPYVDDPSTEQLLPVETSGEEPGRSGGGIRLPTLSEEMDHGVGNGTSDVVTAL